MDCRPALCHSARVVPCGYAGHYPAKANKSSPEPRHHMRKGSYAASDLASDAPPLLTQRASKAVAGYKGHVPGHRVEAIVGMTWKDSTRQALTERTYGSPDLRTVRRSHSESGLRHRASQGGSAGTFDFLLGNSGTIAGTTGTTGTTPSGSKPRRASTKRSSSSSRIVGGSSGGYPSSPQLHHEGVKIPGYGGFIAGRKSENLHGMSTSRAAKENWLNETRNAPWTHR
eukprot:CAMPEP_0206421318 /NCGR_PEP_ID=MMETSP0324_2-20121206/1374_1 /ASSEMBLY_ACC=CAM_ASM_000836 /TAXON_ID=2866 /ORGANISM="Crypthecodinium cohnii, Strain Seligo" /LENGTH=227 /DNA_ID=CAMNT_0053885385 /DNA_START=129 /DNA_END=812 /DNA_ORIENTATION=+